MGKQSEFKKISPDTPDKTGKDEYPEKLDSFADVSGIAHDLNNILNIISGYTEMLQDELQANSTYIESTVKIISGVSKARLLTGELMAVGRFSSTDDVKSDVAEVLEDTINFIKSGLPANICIETDIPPPGLVIKTRPVNIFRIFLNLLKNAIQSMESAGGKISAGFYLTGTGQIVNVLNNTLMEGEYIAVCINDTGPGIDNSSLSRIFEPYYTTNIMTAGRGLGLSVVKKIVTEMNGGINVTSKPGEGTQFTVYLPLNG